MKKIAILGCENSHADAFLKFIKEDKTYSDIQVIGVYSEEVESAKRLSQQFNVPILDRFDISSLDGVLITARHGDNHYKYAKPHIKKGMTMFIDKPITIKEKEAITFMQECKNAGVTICGGSSVRLDTLIQNLVKESKENLDGKTLGGLVVAPINMDNAYGGFYFYSQHLVECVLEIFGRYPNSVYARQTGKTININFYYDNYTINGVFTDGSYNYFAMRIAEHSIKSGNMIIDYDNPCFKKEWDEFYNLLTKKEKQHISYADFIAPVFVLNAIDKSIKRGKTEKVAEFMLQ